MITHLIRIDRVTHASVSIRKRAPRKGHVMCGIRIHRATSTVLAPFKIGDDRSHDVTCAKCIRVHTALEDVLETDFGFPNWDDRTGRFE